MTKEYGNMGDFSPNLISVCAGILSTARLRRKQINFLNRGWICRHLSTNFRVLDACRNAAVAHPLYQEVNHARNHIK